jgi:hypothetical protein
VFLCAAHFSDQQFYNKTRKRLIPYAVPDVHMDNMLSDEAMGCFPVLGMNDIHEGKSYIVSVSMKSYYQFSDLYLHLF